MQNITRANDIRISTRKIRLIADAIRNLGVSEALDTLSIINKRGSKDLTRVINSAVSNAVNNFKLEKNNLRISAIDVNEGTALKRYRPSTKGRIHRYKKRSSNIRIVLEEITGQSKIDVSKEKGEVTK